MSVETILRCWGTCLAAIPWWVWIVLPLAGAVIGAFSYLFGLLLAGETGIVLAALLKAVALGAVAAALAPVGYCFFSCAAKG